MKTLVNTVFKSSWTKSRMIRFSLGIALIDAYFVLQESIYLLFGLLLSIQGLLNASCAGSNCNLPQK